MDLQKLTYLEAIYRLGSFTRASDELHVSQPAVTKAIKQLEHEVGVELIIRGPKSIEFTEAGVSLVRCARRIMDDFEYAEQEMANYSDSLNMTLKLGISNMVGGWLYSEVYSPFLRLHPKCTIILKEYPWAEICQMVIDHELDMAYTTWEKGFKDPNFDLHHYLDSELYVVLHPSHELASYDQIPFKYLDQHPLSVFAKSSLINKIITEKCKQHNISPQLISVTNQFSTMLNMVETGNTIGFVVMDRKISSI